MYDRSEYIYIFLVCIKVLVVGCIWYKGAYRITTSSLVADKQLLLERLCPCLLSPLSLCSCCWWYIMGFSLDDWKACVPFVENVKISGSKGKEKKKNTFRSFGIPGPLSTAAKKRREKKPAEKQREGSSVSSGGSGWMSPLKKQENAHLQSSLGCQGALTRCSI